MKLEAIYFNKEDGGISAIHPVKGCLVEVRYFNAETGAPVSDVKFIGGVRCKLDFRNAKFSKGHKTQMGNYSQIISKAEYKAIK